MDNLRITEILANPAGADKGAEWVELCAGSHGASLQGAVLEVGTRRLALAGRLSPDACSIVRTGTAALRNREAEVVLRHGGTVQAVRTAGSAPEGFGFHIKEGSGFWATSTPGVPEGIRPTLPPLPAAAGSSPWGLVGTAACTAGILAALAVAAFRHERDRHPFAR